MSRPVWLLLLLLIVAGLAGACTLEQRPDVGPDDALVAAGGPDSPAASAEDSARAVVTAFRGALVLGDGARVAALTVPGALLVDQEEGVRWRRSGEPAGDLPSPLGVGRGGLSWTVESSEYVRLADGAGLLTTRFSARVEGEGVPWSAVESVVLTRGSEGWRVRYLHRSRGRETEGGES